MNAVSYTLNHPNHSPVKMFVKIFLHGSPLIASQFEQTLKDFKIPDLRLAKNGEFSYRSVLNSKNSLKQAKAINQIISNDSFMGDSVSGLSLLRDEIVEFVR
jgi:tRNA U34 5-carboxymethylaminomethyl modifying GTPase MnmE/TrmE